MTSFRRQARWTKMTSFKKQARWAQMTSPGGKITKLGYHLTKKVNKSE
jgi:hypothetical protein